MFAATSRDTDPLPVPLGVATRIHDTLDVAFHAHPSGAVMTIVRIPPWSATSVLAGLSDVMQLVGALCTYGND